MAVGGEGRVPARRAFLRAAAAALGAPRAAAGAAPPPLLLSASARAEQGRFHAADFGYVGVFDADWLAEPRLLRLLDLMAASPGAFTGVRFFGALNSGEREAVFPTTSGRVWPAPDAPMNFSAALDALGALVSRGLVPFVALTFFPAAVSPSPIVPPPEGFARWQALLRGFLAAATDRFGAAEVARWWFEVWNEPNMPPFWRGDFDRYLALYRATAEAVGEAGLRLRLGGPAIAWTPPPEDGAVLMRRFLEFLRDAPDLPCDFLSYHRKGIWTDAEPEPRVEGLVAAAEATAAMALELVPERCARGLLLVNNEADMKVGFDTPYAPRMGERFPAWLAANAIAHARLSARHAGRGLRFLAAADDANQHLVRAPFDGRRSLATRTDAAPEDLVKLPVFAFHELLRLMGTRLGALDAAGEAALFPRSDLHAAVTLDETRIALLAARFPRDGADAGPIRLDWALRDIPWTRVNVARFRIDAAHANAFAAAGRRMPARLEAREEVRRLRLVAELGAAAPLRTGVPVEQGRLRLPVVLAGDATALVWITPFDPRRPPPATPGRLAAEGERGDAVLRWTPDPDPTLYGYEVLRMPAPGRADGAGAVSVAPMPLRAAWWVDTAPPAGVAHVYGVRAVSASGGRSALALSPPIRP